MIQIQPRLFLVILDVSILQLRPIYDWLDSLYIVLNLGTEDYMRNGEISKILR